MRVRVRFCVKVCVLMQRVLLVSTKYSTRCVFFPTNATKRRKPTITTDAMKNNEKQKTQHKEQNTTHTTQYERTSQELSAAYLRLLKELRVRMKRMQR